MDWGNLLEGQRRAAQHAGSHARLLAGPGTGKTLTLTWRICFLINELNIPPESIFALTFTRAAAQELRQRISGALEGKPIPRISTLHSFALRQLLKNQHILTSLPAPLRIADDWEERNIIVEDLKTLLGLSRISEIQDLIKLLSADWESLNVEEEDWEENYPNPRFLDAWEKHRGIYGYTLRSELVYQLKKNLEFEADFSLENPINHLVIDEYQDLNKCDLSIIKYLEARGAEIFIAGDDDQSIYGFRKAHPEGIRKFPDDFPGSINLELQICKRCDRDILGLGLFIAEQDIQRIPKSIYPEPSAGAGEVRLLHFKNQDEEAHGIARLCKHLSDHYDLNNILILLRSDHRKAFSRPIEDALRRENIPVSVATTSNILDEGGRSFLAFLRLIVHSEDSLAWRTILQCWFTGIGSKTFDSIYNIAHRDNKSFARVILDAYNDDIVIPSKYRRRLYSAISEIISIRNDAIQNGVLDEHDSPGQIMDAISPAMDIFIAKDTDRNAIRLQFERLASNLDLHSLAEIIRSLGTAGDMEPDIVDEKVNILTMHRAKGLTASAVILAAAEDEYIPGRAGSEEERDELRLLYVSLTRAKHHLFVTYCNQRTGAQSHTGRESGRKRHITRFLRRSRYRPQDGQEFISGLNKE